MTGTQSYYPNLREVLDDRFESLSDAELDEAFEDAFGQGVAQTEYEEFFSEIGKALGKAVPTIKAAVEGAVKGAAKGSALGPKGAIAGALLGGASAAVKRAINTKPTQPAPVGPRPTGVRVVDNVLRRPEISAALDALLAGRNAAIPVGSSNTPVPATEFAGLLANLLGSLAKQPRNAVGECFRVSAGPVGATRRR